MFKLLSLILLVASCFQLWLFWISIPFALFLAFNEYSLWKYRYGAPWKKIYTPVSRAYFIAAGELAREQGFDFSSNVSEEQVHVLLFRTLEIAYPSFSKTDIALRLRRDVKPILDELVSANESVTANNANLSGLILISTLVRDSCGEDEARLFFKKVVDNKISMAFHA